MTETEQPLSTAMGATTVAVAAAPAVGVPPYAGRLLRWSFAVGIVPPILLVAALASGSLYALVFVHVITGGTWTGFDLFMGLVMAPLLRTLEIPQRVEVAKRLTPATFFILPSLATVAITSGIYLAQREGKFDLTSPWILAAGIVVVLLTAQGFGVFLPNGVRIFIELAKTRPDPQLIARLNMRNVRLAGIQAILQLLIIVIMARLRLL
jgi:hypothetical protein